MGIGFRQLVHAPGRIVAMVAMVAIVATWACPAAARAQATSGHLPDPLGWRRLEDLVDRNVEPPLTVAQAEVAAALARDAAERYRAVRDTEVERFLAKADELLSLRRSPDRAAIREAFARQSALVASIEAIDAELFAGLEATLDEPQRATFARVRRARERETLVATMPLGRDPGLRRAIEPCLGRIGANVDEIAGVRGLLDASEPAVNDRLRAVRDRTRELLVAAGAAFEAEVGVLPPIGAAIDPEELERIRGAISSRVAREIDEAVAAIRALRKQQDQALDAACAILPRGKAVLLRALASSERLERSVELPVDHGQVLLGKTTSLLGAGGAPVPLGGPGLAPISPEEVEVVRPRLVAWLEADRPWLDETRAMRDRQLPAAVAEVFGPSPIFGWEELGLSHRDFPEDRRPVLLARDRRAVEELAWLEATLGAERFAAVPPATFRTGRRGPVDSDDAPMFLPVAGMAWMKAPERPADPRQARRASWSRSRGTSWGRGGLIEPPDEASNGSLRETVSFVANRPAIESAFVGRAAALAAIEDRITALAVSEREWSRRAMGLDAGPPDTVAILDRNRAERDAIFLAIAEADESFFAALRSIVEADGGLSAAGRRAMSLAVESARIDRAVDREIAANLGLNLTFEFEARFASPVAAMRESGVEWPNPSVAERVLRATDLALADLRRLRGIAFRTTDALKVDLRDAEATRERLERAREYAQARRRLVANWRSLLGEWQEALPPADRGRFVASYLRIAAPDLFATADDPAPLLAAAGGQPEIAGNPELVAALADLKADRRLNYLPVCEAIARAECLFEPRNVRAIQRLEWERREASAQIVGRLRRLVGDEASEAIGLPDFAARLRREE
jgi:hypothetical protein